MAAAAPHSSRGNRSSRGSSQTVVAAAVQGAVVGKADAASDIVKVLSEQAQRGAAVTGLAVMMLRVHRYTLCDQTVWLITHQGVVAIAPKEECELIQLVGQPG